MKKLYEKYRKYIHTILFYVVILDLLGFLFYQRQAFLLQLSKITSQQSKTSQQLSATEKKYTQLLGQDQYKRNEALQEEIKHIHNTFQKSANLYEQLSDLKLSQKTDTLDTHYAQILSQLADKNYSSAEAGLTLLAKDIQTENDKIAAKLAAQAPSTSGGNANTQTSNTPPGNGYSRQIVKSDVGDFTVDIISADISSTKVIVDTASEGDCKDNCPTLALSEYVSRNGAYAGINGSYFCPSTYPSCAGKTNSFDLLVMNKNKHYFNSDNNIYSTNPAVIIGDSLVRFVGAAQEWGRDTGVNMVLSNYPLLVSGGNIVYSGSGDPKFNSKGPRCFIAHTSTIVHIGCVQNATMSESAHVLKTLGVNDAMNLDEGGSTALWYGGYKAGPGRNIPNAILFVRK